MGSEIEGYLEIKKSKKENWGFVENIPDDRSYDSFAILGNIRNYVNAVPITDSRGIPQDTCKFDEVNECYYNIDNYGFSWFNYFDVKKYNWNQKFNDSRKNNEKIKAINCLTNKWKDFIFIKMKKLAKKYGKRNVRIMFWFY